MQVITANSLRDGRVVFQTAGGWSIEIEDAEAWDTKEAVAAALARAAADAAANRVVDPYPIDVTRDGHRLVPAKLRERIRADGPTTGHSKPKGDAARDQAA